MIHVLNLVRYHDYNPGLQRFRLENHLNVAGTARF
jgi:hypothetical protein